MSTRIYSSIGINLCISSWTSLTSRPSFDFPYLFHSSLLDWFYFTIFSLGGKRNSLGDHQPCTSTFNWTLSPGSCMKERKVLYVAQALCWAPHCLHSFIKTGWHDKASEDSASGMFFFDSGLTHSTFEWNPLFTRSLSSQTTTEKPFLSFTFSCFTLIAQVYFSGFSGDCAFHFCSAVPVLCVPLFVPTWLPIIRDIVGTIRKQQKRVV